MTLSCYYEVELRGSSVRLGWRVLRLDPLSKAWVACIETGCREQRTLQNSGFLFGVSFLYSKQGDILRIPGVSGQERRLCWERHLVDAPWHQR